MMPQTLANADSKEYWEGARSGRLRFQKCKACDTVQFPPRHHCATCWEAELVWVDVSGRGTVESFTTVRRAPLAAFRGKVPYVIGSVLTEEGPRLITNIVGDDALDVRIGDAVKVEFVLDGDGNMLPQFRRTS
jgi:uncharacterized OB-fold protein